MKMRFRSASRSLVSLLAWLCWFSLLVDADGEDIQRFNEELELAEKAPDRDSRVEHLRRALSYRPNHPDNLRIEYRMATMLHQNTDRAHNQGVRWEDALPIYEGIVERYDHMDYYLPIGVDVGTSPQHYVVSAAILAGGIHMYRRRDLRNAREYFFKAMEFLNMTFERRKKQMANAPPPQLTPFEEGPRGKQKLEWRMAEWAKHREDAAAGNVFAPRELRHAEAAVREYGTSFGLQKATEVPMAMSDIILAFPGTPMAKAAQRHVDRATEIALKKIDEDAREILLSNEATSPPSVPEGIVPAGPPRVSKETTDTSPKGETAVGTEEGASRHFWGLIAAGVLVLAIAVILIVRYIPRR